MSQNKHIRRFPQCKRKREESCKNRKNEKQLSPEPMILDEPGVETMILDEPAQMHEESPSLREREFQTDRQTT